MFSLEQIKLLESKISRAINFVAQVTEENNRLKKRNDELEEAMASLKEEKSRVEEGIVSALTKLNQFEDAIERSLSSVKGNQVPAQKETAMQAKVSAEMPAKPAAAADRERPAALILPVESPAPASTIANTKPAMPSAYMVDEEETAEFNEVDLDELDKIEDSGEAELDIF